MIDITQLAKSIQDKLNNGQAMYKFNIVCDTAKFKKPARDKNEITEYINGLFTVNGSDVSNLNNGNLVSTLNCTLRIIMRMKGYEDDVYTTPETESETPQLISYGDNSRVNIMRSYLDNAFQGNDTEEIQGSEQKDYVVSAVYDFAQGGIRGQVEKLGDSFTFLANIYYFIVQQGISSRSAVFTLDNVVVPYQSFTEYRTPTMDGNVYANTEDGSTKNLSSQSTFSMAFELPALSDSVTKNMFEFLFDGELNQAHFLTQKIGKKTKNYLVTYGEIKLIGQTIENLGQSLSLVECPTDYDLIHFADSYFIYEANETQKASITIPEGAIVYLFGINKNGFLTAINSSISVDVEKGDHFVSTRELTVDGFEKVE